MSVDRDGGEASAGEEAPDADDDATKGDAVSSEPDHVDRKRLEQIIRSCEIQKKSNIAQGSEDDIEDSDAERHLVTPEQETMIDDEVVDIHLFYLADPSL